MLEPACYWRGKIKGDLRISTLRSLKGPNIYTKKLNTANISGNLYTREVGKAGIKFIGICCGCRVSWKVNLEYWAYVWNQRAGWLKRFNWRKVGLTLPLKWWDLGYRKDEGKCKEEKTWELWWRKNGLGVWEGWLEKGWQQCERGWSLHKP